MILAAGGGLTGLATDNGARGGARKDVEINQKNLDFYGNEPRL